jgi:Zn-dependent protease
MNLRYGRQGEAIVAAAGPLSNLVLAAAAAIPLRYLHANSELAAQIPLLGDILGMFVFINIVLMVFNLVPVPPLDGSRVLFALLDRRTEYQLRPILEQFGLVILLLLFFVPPTGSIGGRLLLPIIHGIYNVLVGV